MPWIKTRAKKLSEKGFQNWKNDKKPTGNLESIDIFIDKKQTKTGFLPTITMELGFQHRNHWSKCIGEILRNFGKEIETDVDGSERSAEYKFNLTNEFGLFKSILKFISENIELIDAKDLEEMQNFPSFLSPENPANQELESSIIKSMAEEYFSKCTQDSIDVDKLDTIIKKIFELEYKRYNEVPLILLTSELLFEKHYLNAAVFILKSYDEKFSLPPIGHAKLSTLLSVDKNKLLSVSRDIITHALQGLVEMTKNNKNGTSYRDQALKMLKQTINFLKGKDQAIDVPLSPAIDACVRPFQTKKYTRSITDNLNLSKINSEDHLNEPVLHAAEVADVIIEIVKAENFMLARQSQPTMFSTVIQTHKP